MYYLGIDVGSISTDLAVIDEKGTIQRQLYLKTKGRPLDAIRRALVYWGKNFPQKTSQAAARREAEGSWQEHLQAQIL